MNVIVNGREFALEKASAATVTKDGDRLRVHSALGAASALAVRQGEAVLVSYRGRTFRIAPKSHVHTAGESGSGRLVAPMPGVIVDVLVGAGSTVESGQRILVLEAMKTQQPLLAPVAGQVKVLEAKVGQQVREGDLLAEIEPVA